MLLHDGVLGRARFAVTGRAGGSSRAPYDFLNLGDHVGDDPVAVDTNRAGVLTRLAGADRLTFMDQVHGATVMTVVTADPVTTPRADGLVSSVAGTALAVLSADCVPVLLAGRERAVVGVAHAGRLGVLTGVVAATVEAIGRLGVDPEDLVAVVGPAVCAACYEVPAEMRAEVADAVPEAFATTVTGTAALDLPAAVAAQLSRAGVPGVTRLPGCTRESPDLFSHRREPVTGRFGSIAWLPVPVDGVE